MKQGPHARHMIWLLPSAMALAACGGRAPPPAPPPPPPFQPPAPPPAHPPRDVPRPPPLVVPGDQSAQPSPDPLLPDGTRADMPETRGIEAPGNADPAIYLATRMFIRPNVRVPDDVGAVAVIIFPRTAAAQPTRMRDACMAFVGVLGDTRQVTRSSPDIRQMVTMWPVRQEAQLPAQAVLARNDPVAAAAICNVAVAQYDFDAAEAWQYRLKASARLGTQQGPLLAAWSPGKSVRTPHVQILRYDLSRVRGATKFLEAMKVWRNDIEEQPELWRDGWDATRIRIDVASRLERLFARLGGSMRVDRAAQD